MMTTAPTLEPTHTPLQVMGALANHIANAWGSYIDHELPARIAHLSPDAQQAVLAAAEDAREHFIQGLTNASAACTVAIIAACEHVRKELEADAAAQS